MDLDTPQKRHCWECLRRCLVCDSAQPSCSRCSTAGIQCPGYSESKPRRLRWLPPGKVISQTRNSKPTSSPRIKNKRGRDRDQAVVTRVATTHLAIPRYHIWPEAYALVEAAHYCKSQTLKQDNACVHPDMVPIHDLGFNLHVYPLSSVHIQGSVAFPDHLRLSLVCMTLSHRINRMRKQTDCSALVQRFYHYRGRVLRSLSDDVGLTHRQGGDVLLVSIVSLLLADIQQMPVPNWRWHVEGIRTLIQLRGGLRALDQSPGLRPLLRCFVFLTVSANTTSPASDLYMASSYLGELDFIIENYGCGVTPFHTCPPSLFGEMARINSIRAHACVGHNQSQEAYTILGRINNFTVEPWANSKPAANEDWSLVGRIYQAAVALYCIRSLQSLSILPSDDLLSAQCAAHTQRLHELLGTALPNQRVQRFLLWPLVVLGVEASHGYASGCNRPFVQEQLCEMSQQVGSYAPLAAKRVLERFWVSGATSWDACFDQPYLFMNQFAVDMAGVAPDPSG
ncbi:C6 zinc finger domain-protein [Chaetomidium leptoderma]|uniref:C6 zinc finger domain-protein n=1 Tax=Chaetomidium leptoderma TaxID=669021 RepID=A0AAN6VQA9_9PEZI|nr:C6 zinc finger domain-protein [Chaetomidium leptoderma]